MALEIGGYRGDGGDLAALITGTWLATYRGRAWFPLWDRAYVGWRIMEPRILDRELLVCAYDGDALVGCLLGEQTELRVGTQVVPGSLTSYLSVDPSTRHRGVALLMLERQRSVHRSRGLRLSVGLCNRRAGSEQKRFWDGFGRRWPQEFAIVGRYRMWCAVVDPGAIAAAGLTGFERFGPWLGALIPWGWIGVRGARTRPYRDADLPACAGWVHRQGSRADCQMIWSAPRLAVQLDHPYARTWVAEREGAPWGFANGYLIDWSGARTVRVGFVELCAGDGGVAAHASLLVAAGRALAAEGAQMVVVMDAGCQPRAALLAAGFAPLDPHLQTMALLGDLATTLPRSARLHCPFT